MWYQIGFWRDFYIFIEREHILTHIWYMRPWENDLNLFLFLFCENTSTVFLSDWKDDSHFFFVFVRYKFVCSFSLKNFFNRFSSKFFCIAKKINLGRFCSKGFIYDIVFHFERKSWISRNDCKENNRIKYFNQIKHLCRLWWKQSKISPASTCSHVILIRLQACYPIW